MPGQAFAQPGHQCQHGKALADAGRMDPDQGRIGAGQAGMALTFGDAGLGHVMGAQLLGDTARGKGQQQARGAPIDAEQPRGARRGAGHQPPVWLMWRGICPSRRWRE